jgi:hypothetical protein
MILFLVGASRVHIGCGLNPVEVSLLLFRFVWWLDCLLLKEGAPFPKIITQNYCSSLNLLVLIIAIFPFLCQQAIVLVLDATAGPEPEGMGMRITNGIRNVFQRLHTYPRNRGQDERRDRFRLYVENVERLMR